MALYKCWDAGFCPSLRRCTASTSLSTNSGCSVGHCFPLASFPRCLIHLDPTFVSFCCCLRSSVALSSNLKPTNQTADRRLHVSPTSFRLPVEEEFRGLVDPIQEFRSIEQPGILVFIEIRRRRRAAHSFCRERETETGIGRDR